MSDTVIIARQCLREALIEVIALHPEDGRIDEVLATIEDLIDAKLEQFERQKAI